MERRRAYLDHNATAPLRPEAEHALLSALRLNGNASSVHADGRAARAVIDQARDAVAALIGAPPAVLFFTSGGTEAVATALRPAIMRANGKDAGKPADLLLNLATEHACAHGGHGFGAAVETIPVNADGLADLGWLTARLSRHAAEGQGAALVNIQLANNETGVIQPVAEAARLAHAHGALIHCDAVQAVGRIAIDMVGLGVDAMSLSAHKMGGPKGVGALALAPGVALPGGLIRGGGQERSRRAGTENVPAIAGFGAAAAALRVGLAEEAARVGALRDEFERRLLALSPSTTIFGRGAPRLPNTSCVAISGLKAQETLILLDLAGVSVSSGAACSSGRVSRSHVLAAMGVDAVLADGALRVSLGWSSVAEDSEMLLAALERALAKARGEGRAAA